MLDIFVNRLNPGGLMAALLLVYLIFFYIRDYLRDRQITRLGGRAPVVKYRIPLGEQMNPALIVFP